MEPPPAVKILLVDDKPANLLALEAVLEAPGYSLIKCFSGLEALERVEKEEFAIIILDIQMPGLDGYETARRIKSFPQCKDIPIIFITSIYKEDKDVEMGYQAGAIDFFAKPFNTDVLKTKVQLYAELRRQRILIRKQEILLAELQGRRAVPK
jgi:CheY-like chemotaxis protein